MLKNKINIIVLLFVTLFPLLIDAQDSSFINSYIIDTIKYDLILTKKGEYIKADILSIGNKEISFINCNSPELGVQQISSNKIKELKKDAWNEQFFILQNDRNNNCASGINDALLFHNKQAEHVIMGFFFSVFGVVGTLASNPSPEKGKDTYHLSENKTQFNNPDYKKCYKKKAKQQNIFNSIGGCLASALIFLFVFGAH